MSEAVLKFIADLMDSLSIPYDHEEWQDTQPDRYFVGEFIEDTMTTMEEDGRQDTVLILRGFTRKEKLILARDARTIKKHLANNQTHTLPDGTVVAVFYEGSRFIHTGDAELKSIKTNLRIKEWSVN